MPDQSGDLLQIKRTGSDKGLTDSQRATFRGLGLGKNQRSSLVEDTDATRGMVNKIIKWVEVKLVPKQEATQTRSGLKKTKSTGYRVVAKG